MCTEFAILCQMIHGPVSLAASAPRLLLAKVERPASGNAHRIKAKKLTSPPPAMRLSLRSATAIVSVPAVRALAVGAVVWLSLFVFSHWALWRDPHSAYFHSDNIYDLDYSVVRQKEGRAHLQKYSDGHILEKNETSATHAGENPALCAAFATVARDHPDAARYFSDSLGSMLAGLSAQERASFNLTVLFANSDPKQHKEYGAPWVLALVDHAAGYEGISDAERQELRRLEEAKDFQRKGVLDYIYLLDQCYHQTRAPFIAVFEDDVIFSADWLARTLVGLQALALPREDDVIQAAPLDQPPWLYLRLFYTETFMMWEGDDDWLYGNMYLTFALVSLTTATVLLLIRFMMLQHEPDPRSRFTKSWTLGLRLDVPTIAASSLILAPAFLALFFMAGKYSLPMFSLRGSGDPAKPNRLADAGVFPMEKHGCCSQGLVFDRNQVPGLIKRLQTVGRGQTDLMIEEYCNEAPLRRFALGDQVLQHVGLISSRGMKSVNAQSVYAFYFEEKREEEVKAKQAKALEGVDWDMFRALEAPGNLSTLKPDGLKQGLGILPPLK
ncbi:hypothetical protein V8F20_001505 [Naviculisporaceae sp. PSN 640]